MQLLLHADRAAGLLRVLEPELRPRGWPTASPAPLEQPQTGIPSGRRTGYRQPRAPRPPSGSGGPLRHHAGGMWQQPYS